MIENLRDRIHFIHLKCSQHYEQGNFQEANHLEGDVPTAEVMKAFLQEQSKRKKSRQKKYKNFYASRSWP